MDFIVVAALCIILLAVIYALIDNSDSLYVTFDGPKFARKNSVIQLNCSSSIPPKGFYVRFWMNGNIYLTVRKKDNACFATSKRSDCTSYGCSCSGDGRWYTIKYKIASGNAIITMACEMDFPSLDSQVDTVQLKVLDFEGPFISSRRNVSIAGTEEELTCWITHSAKPNDNVHFRWSCPANVTDVSSQQNISISFSKYTFLASAKYNEENCTCIVGIGTYSEEKNAILRVQNSPILTMKENMVCNTSSNLKMICTIDGELSSYGFFEWTHTLNDKFIRRIRGNTTKVGSTLTIDSCSYEDIGQYICSAWNKDESSTLQTNKSTNVYVAGAPVIEIERFYIFHEWQIRFEFFSEPEPTNMELLINGKLVFNYTILKKVVKREDIEYKMFNRTVALPGYVGRTEYNYNDNKGAILIFVIENDYGNTQERIGQNRHERSFDFNLQVVMWILITLSLIILTTTLSTMRISCKNSQEYGAKLQIYHAAPSTSDNRPGIYDRTEPHYDECEIVQPISPYLDVIDNPYQEVDNSSADINIAAYEEVV